jgi:tellurite resistance protein TehA-like permease
MSAVVAGSAAESELLPAWLETAQLQLLHHAFLTCGYCTFHSFNNHHVVHRRVCGHPAVLVHTDMHATSALTPTLTLAPFLLNFAACSCYGALHCLRNHPIISTQMAALHLQILSYLSVLCWSWTQCLLPAAAASCCCCTQPAEQ